MTNNWRGEGSKRFGAAVCSRAQRWIHAAVFVTLAFAAASATSVTPAYSSSGGSATHVAITSFPGTSLWLVTAAENSAGKLEVILWQDTGTALVQMGSGTGGAVTGVAVTGLDQNRVVTADVSKSSGYMEITVWKANFTTGVIAQHGTSISICCTATLVSITNTDLSHVATAANLAGSFYVNAFTISSKGVITTAGSAGSAATATQAVIVPQGTKQVATAIRNGGGKLEIITWSVSGVLVTLESHFTAFAIKQVAATSLFTNQVNTAAINSAGNLELTNWGVSSSGAITKQVSSTVGAASKVAIAQIPLNLFTAVIDGSKDLSVASWATSTSSLTEQASYDSASAINSIAVAPDWASSSAEEFVTAARDSTGKLLVTAWAVSF